MNQKSPLVSICIPTYNRAGMAGKAIESALSQSYTNIEVLVVDNASSDSIEAVVADYHDSRLKFFKNNRNLGLFGNFNRCVELSQGDYVHILHSDDIIDSRFTQTCVEFMESHRGVVMTFGAVQVVSDDDQNWIPPLAQDQIFPAPEGFRQILLSRNLISCPAVMIRKEVYGSVGLYSLEYPYSGDLYQWLRIAKRFDIAYVADATLFYRQGKHSESFQLLFKSPSGYIDAIKIFISMIDELGHEAPRYRRELNIAIRRHMRDCLFAGIARSDLMKSHSPLVFIGLAFNTWGLIMPGSFLDRLKKFFGFFLIMAIGVIICIPGGRSGVRKILRIRQDTY
jgi:glycosyltransferase involved in cell wall biosynthesis